MEKKLLKNLLLALAFLTSSFGFSQEPVITMVNIAQVGAVTPGETASFTLTYKTDGAGADIIDNTQRMYLTGSGAVSPGFAKLVYTQTNGAEATINLSFPWPATGFDTSGTYDYRFFNTAPKDDYDWAPLAEHNLTGTTSHAGATFDAQNGYLGVSVEVIVSGTASTKSFNSFEFSMFPNPVKDVLNITTQENINKVEIFNLLGKKVLSANTKNVDVSSLSKSVYLVKLTSDKGVSTKKLVKN